MESWKSAHQEIAQRVQAGRAGLTRELTLAGILRVAAILLAGFALGVVLHLVLKLGSAASWGMSLAVFAALGYGAWHYLFRPLSGRPGNDRFVEWLDARHDTQKNIIVSAYQLGRDEPNDRFAPEFVAAVVERGAAAARTVDLKHWREGATDRRWWAGLAAAVAVFAVLFVALGPGRVGRAAARVVDPRLAAAPPIVIEVEPGDMTVERGQDVTLAVRVSGSETAPTLRVRESGGIWMTRRLADPVPAGDRPDDLKYDGVIRKIERDHEYQVVVNRTESKVWKIGVNEPPRVSGFEITYFYPDYTGREPETLTSGSGDIAALVGTKIRMKVLTNREVESVHMLSGPTGAAALESDAAFDAAEDAGWETRFTVEGAPREFSVVLRDGSGADRFTSPRFRIEPVPDRAPIVRLLVPDRDIPIPEEMNLVLEGDGIDDFGLTRLDLVYSVKEGPEGRIRLKDFPAGTAEMQARFPWDLVPLNLFPGNEVTYYIELFDNDRVSGPKSARSDVRHLRFPTMDEMYAEVEEDHKEQIEDLSEVLGGSKELKEQLEKLSREAKRGDEMSWDKKKEIESLLDKQADLEKQLSDTAKELQETLDKAQEQTLMSPELLQKMQELSELMQAIKNEKLKESFQKLNEALEKMDKEAVDRALEEFKLDQQEMVKSIDKTIELLKEIRKEEMMEDAVRKAEEMAKEQEDLANKMEKEGEDQKAADQSKKNEDLAKKQEEIQQKAEDLAKKLDELKKLAENEPELKEDLEEMEKSDEPQDMKENMEQSEQEISKGEKEKALKFAFKASEQAKEQAMKMKQAQQESNAAKKRELQEKLMAVIQDLVDVSSAQEELLAQAPATQEGELAARQRVLMDGTLKAAMELEALGKRTLFVNKDQSSKIGNAMRRMDTATKSFVQGNRNSGLREGKESAGDLNEAIVELMQSHSSMCQSGSPSGFMESMQKMAGLTGQQQDLNSQTQGMKGSKDGKGSQGQQPKLGGESASEQLERMAAQQEMIKRGLQDVAGQLGDRKDVLGRLDNLAKEMGEVAEALRKNNVDDRLLERQQRILSRLLDAQKSIRRKDDENERESKTAEQLSRPSPAPLSREQLMGPDRLRTDILRGQSDNYPAQYRALVEKYFRALSEQRAKDKAAVAPGRPAE
jgi:hypothetical protein